MKYSKSLQQLLIVHLLNLEKEKGSFPFLTGKTKEETNRLREAFINTGYMKKMPEDIRQSILENGIRNSHLLTVAPK